MDHPKKEEGKKMRLPVYHSPSQNSNTITIKLNVNPRQIERFVFITLILALLAIIIVQPDFIFGERTAAVESLTDEAPIELSGESTETQAEPATETPATPAETTPTETPAETTPTETPATPAETTPSEPAVVEPVSVSKIAFQITDFTVEKRTETWYKIQGVELKVTNSGGPFKPQVKIWYYDDATKHYFNIESSPEKDSQSFSVAIEKGGTKTFKLTKVDESFSGSELNPTIVAKLYDRTTGKELKEATKKITWDESDFD